LVPLTDQQEVVVARVGKVDQVDQVGALFLPFGEFDGDAGQQQPMHAPVAGDQQRFVHRQQLMRGLFQCGGGDVRVDAR